MSWVLGAWGWGWAWERWEETLQAESGAIEASSGMDVRA